MNSIFCLILVISDNIEKPIKSTNFVETTVIIVSFKGLSESSRLTFLDVAVVDNYNIFIYRGIFHNSLDSVY